MKLSAAIAKTVSVVGIILAALLAAAIWLISILTRIIVGMAHKIR